MAESALTPEEYEEHLVDLRDRIKTYFETDEGNVDALVKEARSTFALANDYREVFDRHEDLKGLVGGLLARQQQGKVVGQWATAAPEPQGCLFGWLRRRNK